MSFWCSKFEIVEFEGVSKTAYEWADYKGVPWETVKKRVQRGHGWKKALELNVKDSTSNKQPNTCRNKKRKLRRSNSYWCYFS